MILLIKIVSKICYRNKNLIFFKKNLLVEKMLDQDFTHQNCGKTYRASQYRFFSTVFLCQALIQWYLETFAIRMLQVTVTCALQIGQQSTLESKSKQWNGNRLLDANFHCLCVQWVAQLCLQVYESPVIVETAEWNIIYKKPVKKRTSDLGNDDCRTEMIFLSWKCTFSCHISRM